MLSIQTELASMGRAEKSFRDAFERLKRNTPDRLPKGTPVSQNNVAKEAGCDSSALRKSRFPSLIAEIQRWVEEHTQSSIASARQKKQVQRNRNRLLESRIEVLKAERNHAFSLLVEADRKILELSHENAALRLKVTDSKVSSIVSARFGSEITG